MTSMIHQARGVAAKKGGAVNDLLWPDLECLQALDEMTRPEEWCPRQDLNLYDVTH